MARIIVQEEGSSKTIELTEAAISFGRGPDNRVVLQDKSSSRRQFQIEKVEAGYKMVDLESRNGTRVNEAFVNQALLKPGDRIRVGRAVVVFEDDSGPSPAPVAPPPPAKAPTPSPAGAASPGSPGPEETSPDPESPRRMTRRHKTTGRMNKAHIERRKEESTIKVVVIIVGLIGVMVLGLIVASSVGGEPPERRRARQAFQRAKELKDEDPKEALKLLDKVPSSVKDIYDDAQKLAVEIRGDIPTGIAAGPDSAEKKEFDRIYDFCELNRQNPTKHARMAEMCNAFKAKYPNSRWMRNINEYLALAKKSVTASKASGVVSAERESKAHLQANEFGLALGKVNNALKEYKDDLDARERLVRLHDEIVDKARVHFKAEHAKATDLEKKGNLPAARKTYNELIIKMGDGTVDELNDFCLIARAARDALN